MAQEEVVIDSLSDKIDSNGNKQVELGNTYLQIAKQQELKGNTDEAIVNYENALLVFSKQNNSLGIINSRIGLGVNFHKQNVYDKAIESFYIAYDILPTIKNNVSEYNYKLYYGIVLHNISITFGEVKYYDAALKYAIKASNYLTQLDSIYIASSYSNLGAIYLGLGQLNESKENLQFALNYIGNNISNPTLAATTYKNLGTIYLEEKDILKALEYSEKALNIYKLEGENIFTSEKAGIYSQIALAHAKNNNTNEALVNLQIGLSLASEKNGNGALEDIYESMVELYTVMDNSEKALESLKQLGQIKDSIYNPQILERITNTQKQFEQKQTIKQNQMKLRLLQQEKTILTYRWYALLGISAILTLFILLLVFRFRYKNKLKNYQLTHIKQEQKQLTDKLRFKNNELTDFALYIVKKNEILEKIREQIKKSKIDSNSDPILNSTYTFISQHLDSLSDSNELKLRIENEYQDFYFKLENKFPDLTEKDKKLCSLLLLDLSSKDIASILNIESASVDKSRYRLRKKLNIKNESSIANYLRSL